MKLFCIACAFVSLLLLTKGAQSDSAYSMRSDYSSKCALVVGTAESVSGVRQIVANIDDRRYMEVFETKAGTYAVSIGTLEPGQVDSVVSSWKATGRVPNDAYCAGIEQLKRPLSGFEDYGQYPDFSFAAPNLSAKEVKALDDLDRLKSRNAEQESVFNEMRWKEKVLNVMTCDVRIEGRIDKIAVEKFKEAAQKFNQIDNRSHFADGADITVCLNSGGGDLSAVKEIGIIITEEIRFAGRFSTLVKNGDECLSACALVFMLGRECFATVCGSSRFLEPLAKLGFHAPYIPTDNMVPRSVLSSTYEAALKDFATVLSFGAQVDFVDSNEMFPGYLIQEMLKYGRDEYFYIDTIERLLIMNINLIGPTKIRSHGIYAIENLCSNANLLGNRNPYSYLNTYTSFETIKWQKVSSKFYNFQRYRMAFYHTQTDGHFSFNLMNSCALEGYTDKSNTGKLIIYFNKTNSDYILTDILPYSVTIFELEGSDLETEGSGFEEIIGYAEHSGRPLAEADAEIDKILTQVRDPFNAWIFSRSDTLLVNLVE